MNSNLQKMRSVYSSKKKKVRTLISSPQFIQNKWKQLQKIYYPLNFGSIKKSNTQYLKNRYQIDIPVLDHWKYFLKLTEIYSYRRALPAIFNTLIATCEKENLLHSYFNMCGDCDKLEHYTTLLRQIFNHASRYQIPAIALKQFLTSVIKNANNSALYYEKILLTLLNYCKEDYTISKVKKKIIYKDIALNVAIWLVCIMPMDVASQLLKLLVKVAISKKLVRFYIVLTFWHGKPMFSKSEKNCIEVLDGITAIKYCLHNASFFGITNNNNTITIGPKKNVLIINLLAHNDYLNDGRQPSKITEINSMINKMSAGNIFNKYILEILEHFINRKNLQISFNQSQNKDLTHSAIDAMFKTREGRVNATLLNDNCLLPTNISNYIINSKDFIRRSMKSLLFLLSVHEYIYPREYNGYYTAKFDLYEYEFLF